MLTGFKGVTGNLSGVPEMLQRLSGGFRSQGISRTFQGNSCESQRVSGVSQKVSGALQKRFRGVFDGFGGFSRDIPKGFQGVL